MKIKKIIGVIMCIVLVVGLTAGCSEKSSSDKVAQQIKEKIIGAWDMSGDGRSYAYFYPNGEMKFLKVSSGKVSVWSYEIKEDTIIVTGKSSAVSSQSDKLTSVTIDEYEMSFTQRGCKETWYACDTEKSKEIDRIIKLSK